MMEADSVVDVGSGSEQLLPNGLMVEFLMLLRRRSLSRGGRSQCEAQARRSCQINRSRFFFHGLRAVGVTSATLFRQVRSLLAGSADAAALLLYFSMAASLRKSLMFSGLGRPRAE